MSHEKSQQLFERARRVIPGGVSSPVRSFKHVGLTPVYFDRGEGPYLYDVDGNRYTDFCLSFGPHLLGHSPAPVVKALQAQAAKATSFGACHEGEVRLAELILRGFPFLDRVRLLNSGTEAVMTAVRVARGATGRAKILAFEGCYHGHSDGLLAKAGSGVAALTEATSSGVPESIVKETLMGRLDQPESWRALIKEHASELAAVLVEPIPANYGLYQPAREQLQELMDRARAAGALVIFDEVISGFRVGLSGASGRYDLKPDLVTLGKVIGGGLPLAAVAGRAAVLDHLAPEGDVYQAGTLSGNPLATASGVAVLEEVFARPPYVELERRLQIFLPGLREVARSFGPAEVDGVGSIFWIRFGGDDGAFPPEISSAARESYRRFFAHALSRGVYFAPSPYEVGFLSTAHTSEVLSETLERLK